jgi:hypothetical protein
MLNDIFIDEIITNLKIIGLIQKNDKLSISSGHLKIDKEDNLQGLRRWFKRDSREQTIIFIKNIMKNLNDLMTRLDIFTKEESCWIIKRILCELENVELGIKNLKITYNDDSFVIVNLDNILAKLLDITNKYNDKSLSSQSSSLTKK